MFSQNESSPISAFIFKVKSYIFGEGKSLDPDHVLYVGRRPGVGVVCDIEGRNRTVISERLERARANVGGAVTSLLPLPTDSATGKGKSLGLVVEDIGCVSLCEESELRGEDLGDNGEGEDSLPMSPWAVKANESFNIDCFRRLAATVF